MAHSKLVEWQPVIGELVIAKFDVESELSIGKIFVAEIRDKLFDGKLYRIRYGHNRENQVFDVIVNKKQLTPWEPLSAWGMPTLVESSLEDEGSFDTSLNQVTPTPGNTPREQFFEKSDALDHFMKTEARQRHKPQNVQTAIDTCVTKMKNKINKIEVEDADQPQTPRKHMRPKGRYNHFLKDELKQEHTNHLQNFLKSQFLPEKNE